MSLALSYRKYLKPYGFPYCHKLNLIAL